MVKQTNGVLLSKEEKQAIIKKLREKSLFDNRRELISRLYRASGGINLSVTGKGKMITSQVVSQFISPNSKRPASLNFIRALYDVLDKDPEVDFLLKKSPRYKEAPVIRDIQLMSDIDSMRDMKSAKITSQNFLYETAKSILDKIYLERNIEGRDDIIKDLEQLVNRYSSE